MNNRWKMNRIGFVNFWLYDEEEFAFYDGRLLLRGQNGSGKSITTQSFIPFVLDGDRTPSRLDPFGSSDRRMEYYFLGEEGKEEATGYLYLEFQKEHTEEYRTIGIGQRAKRGKPMDFWGFIILDGKRIGRDLWLYKEVGSTKIPYDKRDLKTVLGENNRFTDSQREYKDMVNQNIFGFRREEQYEQFIKLLVKVRAPKLSKEFKPTRVYDILNESLQTLSDEDLRTMVDAMEKMDEIQNSLEMLNRAFADTKIIRNEYTRYNQYMLAKKAQSYLKKKEEAQKARQEYDEKQKEQKDLRERLQQVTIRLGELSDRENLIEAERSSLLDANLEDMDQKLEYARREKEELLEKERKLDVKIGDYQEKIHRKHQELTNIGTMLKHHRDALHFQKEEMDTRQEIIRWSDHDKVVQFIEKEQADGSQAISDGLLLYKQSVNECRQLIRDFEEIARQFDDITEEADRIRNEKIKKEQALFAAEQNFLQGQDHLIMQLYSHAEAAGCWSPQEAVLAGAEDRIRAYKGISDGESIRELLRNDYDYQKSRWLEKKQDISGEMDTCQKNLDLLKEEFVQLQRLEEIEPPRSEGTTLSRQLLKEAGIDGIPFYQAMEFSGELSEEECARLEAQLESMGILDALVVSREDAENICEKCPEFLDTLVYASEEGTSGFSKLVVSGEIPQKLKDSVQRILSNIYDAPGREHGVYLGENGRFIQGILAGRARKAEAEFLGRLTRQRKKEERLQSLEKEIEKKEGEFIQIKEQYSVLEAEIEKLESKRSVASLCSRQRNGSRNSACFPPCWHNH